jgi:hypothetical protein
MDMDVDVDVAKVLGCEALRGVFTGIGRAPPCMCVGVWTTWSAGEGMR